MRIHLCQRKVFEPLEDYQKGIILELLEYLCIDLQLSPMAVSIPNRYVLELLHVNQCLK